jgi:hypothetical protein
MKFLQVIFIILFLQTGTTFAQTADSISSDTLHMRDAHISFKEVLFNGDSVYRKIILDSTLLADFWDTVPQPLFWKKIIDLPEDSALINVYDTRQVLDKVSVHFYNSLKDDRKKLFYDSLKRINGLPDSTRVLYSTGKCSFYRLRNAIPNIDGSIPVFIENGVDPWYAQAILLIESPCRLQKSCAGAYGPFQLMKYVARKYGLKVNKSIDERKDLKRSAYAAAMLMKRVCIPELKDILDSLRVPYSETDLWFRLLVMHVYHAGSGNIRRVLYTIRPTEGGMPLIYTVWRTRAGSFQNASQNYSQVLIAAMREFHAIIRNESSEAPAID